MNTTIVFSKNLKAFNADKRFIVNQGGTSSGKTYAILQLLYLIADSVPNILISVVSESLPHLKKGALRDFMQILEAESSYSAAMHNKTLNTFTIGSSMIEFFSADNSDKVRGPRRDILYINECNNVSKDTFDQLAIRTKRSIFLDYNPISEFWIFDEVLRRKDTSFELIKSRYLDNHLLHENIVKEIERRKDTDANWYRIFGEGELGSFEGIIFNNWQQCSEMPETAKRILAIDFGFTNDPTAIIDVRYSDGSIYLDEIVYQTKLTNADIAAIIKNDDEYSRSIVVCDSAEPKSIAELQLMGVRAIAATKGADSIRAGIDLMLQYQMNVTKRSTNLIKELRNYAWKTSKDGKALNIPVDYWNHAIDAARYGCMYLLGSETKSIKARIVLPNR